MRINAHASEQYRRQTTPVEKTRESKATKAQARMTTTSFGFRLGKFGLDYQSSNTVLDPSLSRDVREKKRQANAFQVESEVESLRAKVGREGVGFRQRQFESAGEQPTVSSTRLKRAISAYTKSTEKMLPPPGNMLASVV